MKHPLILCMPIVLAVSQLSLAQPEEDFPPGGPPPRHERDRHPGEPRMGPPGFEPAAPIHKIMMDMRENDPEEFERLQELRMRDPQAFRRETRVIAGNALLEKLKIERPSIHAAIMSLSEEDRAWLFERFAKGGMGMPGMPPPPPGDEREDASSPVRALVKAYRNANSDEERESIRGQVREKLSMLYDERIKEREDQLRDVEGKLEHIRKALEQGVESKDEFIDEKLDVWLDGKREPRGRRPPRPPEAD